MWVKCWEGGALLLLLLVGFEVSTDGACQHRQPACILAQHIPGEGARVGVQMSAAVVSME